jgi:GNAT superfamily N-acetyltransferase
MVVPDDIASWLVLRCRAMADEMPRVRPWSEVDFRVEMTGKSWWTPSCTWLATSGDKSVVGAATLAMREGATGAVPVVHWLLVEPVWRRRGIARLLMFHLEQAAWDAGWRELQLETHAGWSAAVAFYQSIGYAPVRDRSPR